MTQKSYLWTTGGAGDGAAEYSRSDWAKIMQVAAGMSRFEGVASDLANELVPSVSGLNTVVIGTGGAMVDGKPYYNDANVNINIPSAVGSGNTRYDAIVLRADWATQTVRITRIAGVDAANPGYPAITQSSGTTYDLVLAYAYVNTSGTVSVLDNRIFGRLDGITGTQLAVASVDSSKLAGGAIMASARHGYDASGGWSVVGAGDALSYALNALKIRVEMGVQKVAIVEGGFSGYATVTFNYPFTKSPLTMCSANALGFSVPFIASTGVNSGGVVDTMQINVQRVDQSQTAAATVYVTWLAIGVA